MRCEQELCNLFDIHSQNYSFFILWKDADSGLPAVDAKKRLVGFEWEFKKSKI
jgi:hypothetical protein